MNTLAEGLTRHLSSEQLIRLRNAHIGIAGAGGLGSNVAFMLARSGIRRLTLIDKDAVEASNLNRQAYFPEHVGQPKVIALSKELLRLEPEMELALFHETLTSKTASIRFAQCDAVVEAFDDAANKAMLYRTLVPTGVFFVGASGLAGWDGPPMTTRHIGKNAVLVGDGISAVGPGTPPMAPRVMQAASMQADARLAFLLN